MPTNSIPYISAKENIHSFDASLVRRFVGCGKNLGLDNPKLTQNLEGVCVEVESKSICC